MMLHKIEGLTQEKPNKLASIIYVIFNGSFDLKELVRTSKLLNSAKVSKKEKVEQERRKDLQVEELD